MLAVSHPTVNTAIHTPHTVNTHFPQPHIYRFYRKINDSPPFLSRILFPFICTSPQNRAKKLFQEQVEKIVLHHNLTPRSTNILAYQDEERRYLELPIVSATLKERKGAARTAEIIQRTLPHPCLLMLTCGDATAVHVAHQRIHGSDTAKITLDVMEQSEWLNEGQLNYFQMDCSTSRDGIHRSSQPPDRDLPSRFREHEKATGFG